MTYLLFASALSLSAVAAYYSVMGLVAIFAAAPIPILVMGSLLEASKLVVASWLYRSWKEIPLLLKSYFMIALVLLMILTSMGIFGYLSKAHLDQAIPTGDVAAKLSLIDEKIKTEKENLNANRQELNQLDAQVNETISRSGNSTNANSATSGVERSIAIRRAQQKDRARILNEIGTTQAKIAKYNEERAPIAAEVRKVEAEVGPIKYIAALIYDDNPGTDLLEKAVRWVIMMIVIVFDPLAVLMLVAANWQMKKDKAIIQPVEEPSEEVKEQLDDPTTWEKITDKMKWSEVFFKKPVPLPTDAKEIINEFFQKDKVEVSDEKIRIEPTIKDTKPVEFDSAGRRITPLSEQEILAKTIEKDVDDLQKKA
jgi:hypothetical protein